ncbi:MAG: TonB-dependent receptor, partial [Crocinitomicaceae bacterium]
MRYLLALLLLTIYVHSSAQNATLSGKIIDNYTEQEVVGAKITLQSKSKLYRALSDPNGNYSFDNLIPDRYSGFVTMLSFDTLFFSVEINQGVNALNHTLGGSQELEEVKVIGNLVVDRKTPVAVTRISTQQINEELGSRDLPMILNSSPGVYATQQGGGDGDARITIRGFSQRNVGVMIDGVPVNDMENGWVYWSNWFGLDAITGQIQLQRGLGATKLAMPSVGGTMNIITQATGGKKMIKVGQEYGSGEFLRTSLSYKSGTLKNGWGVLFSGSYKQGNGWVDGLNTLGAFYYLKIQKKIKNHIISLSGFGAPQRHGQRSYNQPIAYWDSEFANSLGVPIYDTMSNIDYGRRYNQHWGYYTDSATGNRSIINERMNFYHKPQITLKDFWKVNEKLSWSNIAYLSVGTGGGVRARNTGAIIRDSLGQIDWNQIEYNNRYKTLFGQ